MIIYVDYLANRKIEKKNVLIVSFLLLNEIKIIGVLLSYFGIISTLHNIISSFWFLYMIDLDKIDETKIKLKSNLNTKLN